MLSVIISTLITLGFASNAQAGLTFEDTQVELTGNLKLQPIPGANSFAYKNGQLQIVVSRTTPKIPVSSKTVIRAWSENMRTVGLVSDDKECKEYTRFHFVCSHQDKDQKILLSYSRKDIIAAIISGKTSKNTDIKFTKVKK